MSQFTPLHTTFKGVQDTSVGAYMTERPIRQGGAPRGSMAIVEGRSGSLWLPDGGAEPVIFQSTFNVPSASNRIAALNWLSGSGNLIFSDDPLYYWEARVINELQLRHPFKRLDNTELSVVFSCNPYKKLINEAPLTFTMEAVFAGQGSVESRPLITVTGSGDVHLMINDCTVAFDDIDGYITLDCDAMIALKGDVNVSPQVSLLSDTYETEWPTLLPAGNNNAVSWELIDGTVTSVAIQPRWRFR